VFGIDPATGEVIVVDANSLVYETNASFDLWVEVEDLAGATDAAAVTIVVTNVNDPPQASDDSYTVDSLHTLTVVAPGLLTNDVDSDGDTLTVLLVSGPSHGTLEVGVDGTFEYTPDEGYVGDDSFTYRITDGFESSGLATADVRVLAVDSPPEDPPVDDDDVLDEQDAGEDDVATDDFAGEGSGDSDMPDEEAVGSPPTEETPRPVDRSDVSNPKTGQPTAMKVAVFGSSEDESPFSAQSRRNVAVDRGNDPAPGASLRRNDINVSDGGQTTFDRATRIQQEYGTLWHQLDTLQDDLVEDGGTGEIFQDFVVGTTAVSVTGLTVGYVIWLIRGGTLLAGLMSSVPAWCSFDPLPVLDNFDAFENRRRGDDTSLQSLVEATNPDSQNSEEQG